MKDINQQLEEKIVELQQQQRTISQQEQFLRSIYDNVREAIFVVDIVNGKEFQYQGFNSAAKKLTGIEDVIDKTPAQLLPPEVATAVEQRYRQCLTSKTTISYEECLPFQGRDTWWLTTLNPIQDETGKIYRIIGTSLNIDDRKQVEQELDREKKFLQALLDNLSDGIVACDRDGILTLFNRATEEFHGLPQDNVPSEEWAKYYDLYLPDGETPMTRADIPLFRALKGEFVRDVEMTIVPKQGKPRTVLVNSDPIFDRERKKIGAIAAMRDITERRQAETELKEERLFVQAVLENLRDGVVACDKNGILALFNQASQEFFVVPQEPLPPERWAEHYALYDAEGKEYLKQSEIPLFRAFAGESFSDVELMVIPSNGKNRTLVTNGSPIIDGKGNKLGAVITVRDITERKEAELAVAQLNAELESKVRQRTAQLEQLNSALLVTTAQLEKRNQELDRFAYIISHDLKAPLRAISNLSLWIEEDLADSLDEDTRHNMNLLRNRVQRLNNMIDALLAYSRVGRMEFDLQEVEVESLLKEILDLLDASSQFQVEIQGEMPVLNTQLVPLQQVFNNLISNAIKHSDRDRGKITISAVEYDDYYEFSVTDNGQGIDPKDHERIFTIFQTLDAKDSKENTGIGLAIVQKAVESQGGIIKVESQLGEKTTFSFTWKK